MKYEAIPITPAVITWARKRAGMSLEDASKKFRRIEAWEADESLPTYPQIEGMADTFKVPAAVFFFPEPPDTPDISESFRTIPEHEFDQLPGRIRFLVRKAKTYQISLSELTDGKNTSDRLIIHDFKFSTNTAIRTMAARVRKYLDVPLEEQTQWADIDIALSNWREIVQAMGVAVFKDAFRDKTGAFSGFCLYDAEFPLIYINNSTAKARQIFTLFHELAHLLFHTSGVDGFADEFIDNLPPGGRKIEVICNRFASEFLVPQKEFEAVFKGMKPSQEAAAVLADHFNVSRTFIYLRFLKKQLISQKDYNEAAKKWADKSGPKKPGGNPYYTRLAYLDRRYTELAFSRYFQNRINDIELADYLDISPRKVGTLEEYFLRGSE